MAGSVRKRRCQRCGGTYSANVEWQKFCSRACRSGNWLARRMVQVPEGALALGLTPGQRLDILRDDRPRPGSLMVHDQDTGRTYSLEACFDRTAITDTVLAHPILARCPAASSGA